MAPKEKAKDETGRVRVAVRVRPLNANEVGGSAVSVGDGRTLAVTQREAGGVSSVKEFAFDVVSDGEVGQEDVFESCGAMSLLDAAARGHKVTIFAYGATGSGKTHTILGPEQHNTLEGGATEAAGLIERATDYLFRRHRGAGALRLVASFYEVYNEQVFDLLDAGKAPLAVRHNTATAAFFVPGLVELECVCADDVSAVVTEGRRSRRRAAHKLNRDSSRGHALLAVRLVADGRDCGKVSFVDLAGNERLGRSQTTDAAETGSINRSLFALGKVIAALTEESLDRSHIPYRDSTLTKLLMDSLGGDVFTLMIACVSPAAAHLDETLCTLQYARRAKGIVNAPRVSLVGQPGASAQHEPDAELLAELASLRDEVASLREENQRLRGSGLSARSAASAPSPQSPRMGRNGALIGGATFDGGFAGGVAAQSAARRRRPGRIPDGDEASEASGLSRGASAASRRSGASRASQGGPRYDALERQLAELQRSYGNLEAKLADAAATSTTLQQAQQQAQQQAHEQHAWQQQQWSAALQQQQQHAAAWQQQQQPSYLEQYYHANEPTAQRSPRLEEAQVRRRTSDTDPQHVSSVRRSLGGDVVRRHREDLQF
ncbi:P-loop containing nucleoside triphosphate hydrolase protein [Pelagophyceae sp. CCMP2097]|nr:P-loop containing nucleoside triphosphate hydrolase protein [Pelagophyceae sp. CCMP2097]